MKNQKGQVSEFIILAGIIIIVGAMIFLATGFFGNIGVPESRDQSVSGSADKVAGRIGELVRNCWSRSGEGSSSSSIACFKLRINPDSTVKEETIYGKLEEVPSERVEIPATMDRGTFKISYNPESQTVEVKPF